MKKIKKITKVLTESKYGKIKGILQDDIRIWRGIPYAEAPIGDLRFRRAQYIEYNEHKIVNAVNFGAHCLQTRNCTYCNEACLTLNIWSKSGKSNMPVIFYIHGGSFIGGSGSDFEYEGSSLAVEDVVVITLNYRLGILGMSDFSFLGDRFETNCGLSDIICALRWVNDNIENFGGDPNNITVMGQSAGAISIYALLTIPKVQKYISKAIVMSGSPTLMHTKRQAEHLSQEFMVYSGLETTESLIETQAQNLINFQDGFAKQCGLGEGTFTIEIDGDILTEYPIPAIKSGKGANIPLLIGSVREEMSFLFVKPFNKTFDIGGIFNAGIEGEDSDIIIKIKNVYNKYGNRKNSIMLSDLIFRMPSVWFAEVYSKIAPTWMYRFDYESFVMKISGLHSFHYTDIPMIFRNTEAWLFPYIYPRAKKSKSFNKVSYEMRKDFITFVKTGKLNWQQCNGTQTPAKCYNKVTEIAPIVDDEIKNAYIDSNFYRRSMMGESNNLN